MANNLFGLWEQMFLLASFWTSANWYCFGTSFFFLNALIFLIL